MPVVGTSARRAKVRRQKPRALALARSGQAFGPLVSDSPPPRPARSIPGRRCPSHSSRLSPLPSAGSRRVRPAGRSWPARPTRREPPSPPWMLAASVGKEEKEETVQQAAPPKRSGTASSSDASGCCLCFRLCLHLRGNAETEKPVPEIAADFVSAPG